MTLLKELYEAHKAVSDIDRDEYPKIKGLEGPFKFKNGRVYYYDPKEGKYYNNKSDVYLDDEEAKELHESSDKKEKSLWKFNKVTGYWVHVRKCADGTENKWLKIFKDDEPNEKFKISTNKPVKESLELNESQLEYNKKSSFKDYAKGYFGRFTPRTLKIYKDHSTAGQINDKIKQLSGELSSYIDDSGKLKPTKTESQKIKRQALVKDIKRELTVLKTILRTKGKQEEKRKETAGIKKNIAKHVAKEKETAKIKKNIEKHKTKEESEKKEDSEKNKSWVEKVKDKIKSKFSKRD